MLGLDDESVDGGGDRPMSAGSHARQLKLEKQRELLERKQQNKNRGMLMATNPQTNSSGGMQTGTSVLYTIYDYTKNYTESTIFYTNYMLYEDALLYELSGESLFSLFASIFPVTG